MPRRLTDGTSLVGKTFGKWLVVEAGHTLLMSDGSNASAVKARCECGLEKTIKLSQLKRGETEGCRYCRSGTKTHGRSKTSEYRTWEAMIRRCYVPHATGYKDYGGRGVTVCDRWNPKRGGSFENFYADMGPRPSKDHQLDKDIIDGNLVYGPSTAKWVHRHENAKRKRNAVWVQWKGSKVRLADLADETGIPVKKLWARIKTYGLSVEEAVSRG